MAAAQIVQSNGQSPVQNLKERFGAWVNQHLRPEWRGLDAGGDEAGIVQVRREWGRQLAKGGWAGPGIPTAYGGLGLTVPEQVDYLQVLVAAGAPEPMNANGLGIFAPALLSFGSEDQKQRWLPPMLEHDELWCQGFSEPEAGSDLRSLRTRAEADGTGFRLHGQKVWTSYAHYADRAYVLVRVPGDGDGLTMVGLDLHQAGVSIRPLRNIAGSSEFCEVFFDGPFVGPGDVVGAVGQGWEIATYALTRERSTFMAQRSLQLIAEFDDLLSLRAGRRSPGGIDPHRLIDAFVRTRVVRAAVLRGVELTGAGEELGVLAPMAKLTWSEAHQEQLDLAMDILGEEAVVDSGPGASWARRFFMARGETIYGGTSEIQRNLIGKLLGLPSDRGR